MESLGFIESPATVSNTWFGPAPTAPVEASEQTPRIKRGAHERTVADLEPNDTTELLIGKNVRWGLILVMVFLLGALGAGAIWLVQRPAAQAESALAAVDAAAESLEPELASLSEITVEFVDQNIGSTDITARTRAVDAQARDLFNAAATLPASAADQRSLAADVATTALDASRLISDAVAYRSTVIQILVPPELETDPELIALDDAVRAFGTWQQSFNQIRTALPTRTMSAVSQELAVVAGNLESIQSRYIDGIRDDDAIAASEALGDLADQLTEAESVLTISLADVQTRARELIEASLSGIDELLR